MDRTRFLLVLVVAALPLLAGCAGRTPEPRLPATTAAEQTRNALVAAGLRPGTIEGPLGQLHYFEGGEGKTVVLLHGTGGQAGDWNGVAPALLKRHHLLVL